MLKLIHIHVSQYLYVIINDDNYVEIEYSLVSVILDDKTTIIIILLYVRTHTISRYGNHTEKRTLFQIIKYYE